MRMLSRGAGWSGRGPSGVSTGRAGFPTHPLAERGLYYLQAISFHPNLTRVRPFLAGFGLFLFFCDRAATRLVHAVVVHKRVESSEHGVEKSHLRQWGAQREGRDSVADARIRQTRVFGYRALGSLA